jgi:translation initiation factor 1
MEEVVFSSSFSFSETEKEDVNEKNYVHIRIQQRNGRKSVTTIQGLPSNMDYDRILKSMKKNFCCNGHIVKDDILNSVIQLQGDQRKNIVEFMIEEKLVTKDLLKIHGF